jgi:DNA-directed RNA polymerase
MTIHHLQQLTYDDYAANPEMHPLWQQQVDLEREMMQSGADAVRDAVIKSERRDQMTRSPVVRGVMTDWLPELAAHIRDWVRQTDLSRGPKPIALPYIKAMDPHVAALVALKAIMDGIGRQSHKLVQLAMDIGRTCEHEEQIRLWEKKQPKLFYHYKDEMDRNRATDVHRRRVNVNQFAKLCADEEIDLSWQGWGNEVRFRVGIALIDAVITKTGWFELAPDPEHVFKRGAANTPQYVVAPTEEFRQWLGKAMDRYELNSPHYRPTVMPPKRWDGIRDGGYWTPYVRAPRLVRFKAHQETQKEYAADEYDAIDMPIVYDAIHLLQETAWRVNKRVLDVALKCWALDEGIAKLPRIEDLPLPDKTVAMMEDFAAAKQARKEKREHHRSPEVDAQVLDWKKRASPIYRFNAKRWSRMRATTVTIQAAQRYAECDRFYFPHMLDFRGRMYPIPNFLQPQGDDLARGLLTFADALPITEDNGGAGWLAIQLASTWGHDKVSYDERIVWVEANEVMFRLIAEDPMQHMEWAKADKPWQALAACYEWVDFLNTGWGFMSSLPVMVDGTCNGIQHLSAILRDEVAGRYVNLTPSNHPKDIYKHVAEKLQEVLEEIEMHTGGESWKATYWLNLCNRDLPRSLTKRQVMVLPYGGSRDAFYKYTRAWLDEMDKVPADGGSEAYRQRRNELLTFMVKHMWAVVSKVVAKGLAVMDWLQKCAKVVASSNQPIYWQVPSGYVVRHFYGVNLAKRVKIMLSGEQMLVTLQERTAKLSPQDQLRGIAPNFIHSLDGAALMLCLKRCRAAGIEDFASVHDAFGTHAANMNALAVFLREAFVEVHEHDVLGEFRAACQRILVDVLVAEEGMDPLAAAEKADEMLPEPLEKGELDLAAILESDYFFA